MLQKGFEVYEGVFSEEECQAVTDRLSSMGAFSRAGKRNLMSLDLIAAMASTRRLATICQELTGTNLVPYKATLFNKTGKANWLVAWHQDTALPIERDVRSEGWGPSSVKDGVIYSHAPSEVLSNILALRIHLDPSSSSNGPLRVIPGSHRHRVGDDVAFGRIITKGPQIDVTVGRGGVIAMSPLLIHASSKCAQNEPRRVLHIEYAPSLEIADGIRLALA